MDASSSSLQLTFVATLEGHKDWVTAIAAPNDPTKKFIVTASRGKFSVCTTFHGWMDARHVD